MDRHLVDGGGHRHTRTLTTCVGIVGRDVVGGRLRQVSCVAGTRGERLSSRLVFIPAADGAIGTEGSLQGHIAGATTVGIGQRGHLRLRVHGHRQGDHAIAALLILNGDGLHTGTRDLRASEGVRKLVATEGQLLLAGGAVTDGHMGRHDAVATGHNGSQCLGILTTLGVGLAVPSPAVALINRNLCILDRIDGQVEGHHAVAVVHGLQGSGVVTRSGEGLAVPLILYTSSGAGLHLIGRINRNRHVSSCTFTRSSVIHILRIEGGGDSDRCRDRSTLADRLGHLGIRIPMSGHACDHLSGQCGIASTADRLSRQDGSGRQGVHHHFQGRQLAFAPSGRIFVSGLV